MPSPQELRHETVRSIYDPNDALIRTFVDDTTKMYTCAYFPTGNETLAEAQIAMTDYALAKLQLQGGQTLLDIGSGYGHLLQRACQVYCVKGIGLNISQKQVEYSRQANVQPGLEYRQEGWETYEEGADAIILKGSFEHFEAENHRAFFAKARQILSGGGLMLLHTITLGELPQQPDQLRSFRQYTLFIRREIFPKGYLRFPQKIRALANEAGFELQSEESFQPHYIKTLQAWRANLKKNRYRAIEVSDESTYAKYARFLEESEVWFEKGAIDVRQFLFRAWEN